MNIEYIGSGAVIDDGKNVFSFQVMDNPREFDSYRLDNGSLDWTNERYHLGEWKIFPYGNNNQLPKEIRDVVQNNYIAPGLMKKKTQWLWGKGPKLYVETFENRALVREWQENDEIQSWLDSWDYESYLTACAVDFSYIEGVWTKFVQSRSGRVSKPKIGKLEHIPTDRARLAAYLSTKDNKPTHGVVTDWSFEMINAILNPKVYPLYDFANPFKYKHSLYYSNMYSFCADYYTVPDVYGSLEWLRRSTAIPIVLKAMSKNSMNIKYHVVSPQKFWDDKKEQLKEQCTAKGIAYKDSMLATYKEDFLREISKVLSSAENTGKFWHTTKQFEVDGTNLIEHGWEIKELPNNIKSFIDSQIEISKRSDHAVSSGIGIGSVLGNVSDGASRNSGSDRIYAMKDYLQTGIDIPEMLVTKSLNFALRANWPGTKFKIGFYHMSPEKEEDVNPESRTINTV
jgi:hypothetical protein